MRFILLPTSNKCRSVATAVFVSYAEGLRFEARKLTAS